MIRPALIVLLWSLAASSGVNTTQQFSSSSFVLDREKKEVARQGAKGDVVWSVKFDDYIGGVRPPHLLWDERRVYFTHKDGVTALDAGNGNALWHAQGPECGLLLSDGLLLGTGPLPNKDGTFSQWLFACDVAKGTVVFKCRLADDMSDPLAVEQVAGLFLVQIHEKPGGKGYALLIDRQGAVCHRFDRQVITGKKYDGDVVFLTSKNVVRVTAKDKVAWTLPFDHHQWIAGGQLIDLADGDAIAFQFGRISDSGVSLIRFNPTNGKEKWRLHCGGLGVSHSEYSHTATVAIEGEKLRVTSEGSSGTFVEILDLKTGRQLERTSKGG
jgi:outer membrane protein assembly factor BamB